MKCKKNEQKCGDSVYKQREVSFGFQIIGAKKTYEINFKVCVDSPKTVNKSYVKLLTVSKKRNRHSSCAFMNCSDP